MEGKIGADHVIAALAGKQAGRVSREQLLGQGIGAKAIDHRLRQGRLHAEHRGVFAVGHPVSSVEGRWWAALLACGEDAVLSHMTAAVAWALAIAGDGPVEVTAPHSRQQLHGVRRHSSRSLGEHDRTELRGMPITTPERTVLDLASRLPDRRLERLLDRGEQLRLLDLRDLRRSLTEHSRRAGTPRLRRVLERFAPTVTRSELEERFLELCAEQGLPRPQMNPTHVARRHHRRSRHRRGDPPPARRRTEFASIMEAKSARSLNLLTENLYDEMSGSSGTLR
jgi:hypothetical protein